MKEITSYVVRNEATVLEWVRKYGFPARKISGQWQSDRTLVDKWRVKQIMNQAKDQAEVA